MHGSRHFSYRRDKTAERQVSVILKREKACLYEITQRNCVIASIILISRFLIF